MHSNCNSLPYPIPEWESWDRTEPLHMLGRVTVHPWILNIYSLEITFQWKCQLLIDKDSEETSALWADYSALHHLRVSSSLVWETSTVVKIRHQARHTMDPTWRESIQQESLPIGVLGRVSCEFQLQISDEVTRCISLSQTLFLQFSGCPGCLEGGVHLNQHDGLRAS